MAIKVGINGFGRIGRLVFRLLEENDNFEVVAINGRQDADVHAHLLKYDSAHGRFNGEVSVEGTDLIKVNGRDVHVFKGNSPAEIPWKEADVQYVVEGTGVFNARDKAKGHFEQGVEKVFVTAPADDMPMIIYGVNNDTLDGSEDMVSTGSCTTNCLAPMAAALQEEYGIKHGLMTTIHAYTGDQNLVDSSHKHMTRARAAAANIIPTTTGAAKAIGKVIPELNGKLDGSAQRVPVLTGSVTELTVVLEKETSVEAINKLMESRKNDAFDYTEDPIVSSDVIGDTHGSIFDATQTKIQETEDGQLVRTVAWYDNEMGFVGQFVRVMDDLASKAK